VQGGIMEKVMDTCNRPWSEKSGRHGRTGAPFLFLDTGHGWR